MKNTKENKNMEDVEFRDDNNQEEIPEEVEMDNFNQGYNDFYGERAVERKQETSFISNTGKNLSDLMLNVRYKLQKSEKINKDLAKEIAIKISDVPLRDRVMRVLNEEVPENSKEVDLEDILISSLDAERSKDTLDREIWDLTYIPTDTGIGKLKWEQIFNIINEGIMKDGLYIESKNRKIFDFLRNKVTLNLTKGGKDADENKKQVNGIKFRDTLIIKRTKNRRFVKVDAPQYKEFVNMLKDVKEQTASSVIKNESRTENDADLIARDYISELRDEQKKTAKRRDRNLAQRVVDINAMGDDINRIKENKRFRFRPKIWIRSLGRQIARLWRLIKYHKKTAGAFTLSIAIGIASIVSSMISAKMNADNIIERGKRSIKEALKNLGNKILENIPEAIKAPVEGLLNQFRFYLDFLTGIIGIGGLVTGYITNLTLFSLVIVAYELSSLLLVGVARYAGD